MSDVFILPADRYDKLRNRRVTVNPGMSIFVIVGWDEKLLIPANRMTADTIGSVSMAARIVPAKAPMAAAIPNRREKEIRSILVEHPIAL